MNERGVGDFKKGLPYSVRVPGFAGMRKAMSVSLFSTVESGQYKDADAITTAIGGEWKNILHGDNAGDLTQAIHWDSKKQTLLASGKFQTTGSHHDWATWVLLKDYKTGVVLLYVAYHAEYRPRSREGKPSEWDLLRESQAKSLIAKSVEVAAKYQEELGLNHIPIMFTGDFNQASTDVYDGVGKAMNKSGFVDVETLTTDISGPQTTLNGMDPKRTEGRRIDRIFVPRNTKVGWVRTTPGYPNTDHNGVSANITISND